MTKPLVTQVAVIAKSMNMSQRSSIAFRCPPTTGVLSRLTLAGPPPLPGERARWPESLRGALLGDDLEPGLSAKRGCGSPRSRDHGDRTSRILISFLPSGGPSSGVSHELPCVFGAPVKIAHDVEQALSLRQARRLVRWSPRLTLGGRIARWLASMKRRGASADRDLNEDHLHVAACTMVTVVHYYA